MLVVCLLVALASGQSTAPPLPQHISDFTDPATGRNPFLDLQEGPPGGRGLHHLPPLDFELVEGGAEDRHRGFQAPPTTTVAPPTTTATPLANKEEEEPEEEEEEEGVAVSMVTVAAASAAAALLTALVGVVWWKWRRRSPSPFSAAENGQLRKS